MDSVFQYNKPVSGKQFVGRAAEVRAFANLVSQGENVVIYEPPKTGKTSLVQQGFYTLKSLGRQFVTVQITLLDVRTLEALALRLVAVPLVCIPLLMFMPAPYEVRMVLMIAAAAPAASATSMLALKYGGDYSYGTGLAVGSTIVSMVTMPLVLALAMQVL